MRPDVERLVERMHRVMPAGDSQPTAGKPAPVAAHGEEHAAPAAAAHGEAH
jgi:NADH-quinone oxidoreductase subunit M